MSDESRAAVRDVLATMRELADQGQRFPEHDREFHRLIFVDLGNDMLLQLFDLLWQAFHRAAPPQRGRTPAEAYDAHAKIFDAIVAGDADRACTAIHDHYVGIESRLRETGVEESVWS